jgi:hypothetical protein
MESQAAPQFCLSVLREVYPKCATGLGEVGVKGETTCSFIHSILNTYYVLGTHLADVDVAGTRQPAMDEMFMSPQIHTLKS